MNAASRPPPHVVAIVAFPPAQLLDVTGPMDVFGTANELARLSGRPEPYRLLLAAPEPGPLPTSCGIALLATHGLSRWSAGTLLVAGGPGARALAEDRRLMARLRALCERTPRVGSICTGAFALAATGLLDGRRATTHWARCDELAARYPRVRVDRDALFVADGKVHSSAGISAGVDYALSLVEHDLGRAFALEVARVLVVFLKRPGGQSQFSAQLHAEAAAQDPDRFDELLRWMAAHLRRDLSVPALAERAAMSPRNFARRFKEAMSVTPARYVQRLRVDAARRLLTDGALPIARVADRCGFPSAEAMRVAFQRELRVCPADFRARFRSSAQGRAKRRA
jgi:transcriptional regulator GlxA family with amidase domain